MKRITIKPKTFVFHNGFRATFSKMYELYPMLEKELEDMFVKEVESKNGVCIKLNPYKGVSGLPDRLVVLPDNKVGLVELKRPNGKEKPRLNQVEKLNQLKQLTDHVYVLDHPDDIDDLLNDIRYDEHPELRWSWIDEQK